MDFFPKADNREKVVEKYLNEHSEVRIISVEFDYLVSKDRSGLVELFRK